MKAQLHTSFHLPLHKTNQGIGAVYHFLVDAENDFEITMPFKEHTYALIINLSASSGRYLLNGQEGTLPAGYYNIFNLPVESCRWILSEGMNWFLVVNCTRGFLDGCREWYPKINAFLDETQGEGVTFNPVPHLSTPNMLERLDSFMEYAETKGALHEMRLSCTAAELLFDALKNSILHDSNEIDDATMEELERVYQYMMAHLRDIQSPSDLAAISLLPEDHFHHVFELVFERTPAEMLHRERMIRAVALLKDTHDDLFDVSVQAGFSTFEKFVDAFVERYGMSPQLFRSNYGPKYPPSFFI